MEEPPIIAEPPPPAPSNRIPNLFHLFLFLGLTVFAALIAEALFLALTYHRHPPRQLSGELIQFAIYLLALAAGWFVFPPLWRRPFLDGLSWNAAAARPTLILAGFALSLVVQGVSVFIPHPKDLPIDELLRNPGTIWLLAFFGIFLGPLFEEVVFRGFLLPALAHAIDWLRLPRHPGAVAATETLYAWRAQAIASPFALTVASILTSLLFALLHGFQLGWTWAAVAALFVVSIVLCVVRIRTRSLAASTLVHAAYNALIFLLLFIGTSGFRHMERL